MSPSTTSGDSTTSKASATSRISSATTVVDTPRPLNVSGAWTTTPHSPSASTVDDISDFPTDDSDEEDFWIRGVESLELSTKDSAVIEYEKERLSKIPRWPEHVFRLGLKEEGLDFSPKNPISLAKCKAMLQDADEVKKIAAAAEALRTANDYALSAFLESTQLEWVQRWLEVFDLIFSIQDPVHDRGVEPNPLTGNIFKEILKTQEVFKQRSRVLAVSEIDEYNPESQPAGSSMTISNYGRGVYIGEWDYPGWLTGWNWDQKNPDQPSLFHEALEEEGRNPSKEEQIRRIEEDSLSDIQDALDASGKPRRSTRRRMVAQGQADEKKDRDWEERQRRYDKERRQRRKEYGKVKKNSKKEKDKKEKESTSVRR